MNRPNWILSACRMAATGALSVAAMASAAEPKAETKSTPTSEDPTKKPAVVDEPAWTYEEGQRRDPFTFRKEFPVPAKEIVVNTETGKKGEIPTGGANEELLRKVKEAEAKYVEAEKSLIDLQGAAVVEKADEALKLFKSGDNEVLVRDIREKLLRVRIAGLRMKNRQDAQSEFDRLNIRVTGVVAKERQSQAIINAKDTRIVGKGDLISLNENQEVVVEDILPEQVIVLYKGYKMILTMSEPQAK